MVLVVLGDLVGACLRFWSPHEIQKLVPQAGEKGIEKGMESDFNLGPST
jgi:hypothetical protein